MDLPNFVDHSDASLFISPISEQNFLRRPGPPHSIQFERLARPGAGDRTDWHHAGLSASGPEMADLGSESAWESQIVSCTNYRRP